MLKSCEHRFQDQTIETVRETLYWPRIYLPNSIPSWDRVKFSNNEYPVSRFYIRVRYLGTLVFGRHQKTFNILNKN